MHDEPSVLISGYLDGYQPPVDPGILLDTTAWLDQPAVWPALLWAVGGARAAIDAFDVDLADVDVFLDRLGAAERWPVFTINLKAVIASIWFGATSRASPAGTTSWLAGTSPNQSHWPSWMDTSAGLACAGPN
jgi:hypothetical protein